MASKHSAAASTMTTAARIAQLELRLAHMTARCPLRYKVEIARLIAALRDDEIREEDAK